MHVVVFRDHTKRRYYMSYDQQNPTLMVPLGPTVDWSAPHDLARLS